MRLCASIYCRERKTPAVTFPGIWRNNNNENFRRGEAGEWGKYQKKTKKNSPRIPENLTAPIYIDLGFTHVRNLSNHVLFITKEAWEFMKDWLCCIKDDTSSIFAENIFMRGSALMKVFLVYELVIEATLLW